MTGTEARKLRKGARVQYGRGGVAGRVHTITMKSMISIAWDEGGLTHHDPDFMDQIFHVKRKQKQEAA